NYPGAAEYERRMRAAAAALEKSQYPPIRRASALVKASLLKANHKDDPAARKEAARLADAALALLPESVRIDGTSAEAFKIWYDVTMEALHTQKLLTGDSKAAYDKVDAALAKAPAARPLRLRVKGKFYLDYAW